MLKNYTSEDIKNDKKIHKNFLNANFQELNLNCNIYKGNFYLDSFNYFTVSDEYKTFDSLFSRDIHQSKEHFYTKDFFDNFKKNIKQFKEYNNTFILGSNAADNYYSNLLQFLPRIFFIKNKKIQIAIHRNSSTKFREFIKFILDKKNIEFSYVYLDDGFYKFINCEIPQFFNLKKSIRVLKSLLLPSDSANEDKKIYLTREDSSYRKIINESDIIPILRAKGYKVINPQLYSIQEQIRIFSQADKIIGPHGSNLSNIIFSKPGTEIYEIGPEFKSDYEKVFENRYKDLAIINNLKYFRFLSDTVPVENHSNLAIKYINKKILNNSNYYKNLIVKVKDINNIE